MRVRPYESAMFWITAGGVVVLIGASLVGVGSFQVAGVPGANNWASPWFDIGWLVVVIGGIGALWGIKLYRDHLKQPLPVPDPPRPSSPQFGGVRMFHMSGA